MVVTGGIAPTIYIAVTKKFAICSEVPVLYL